MKRGDWPVEEITVDELYERITNDKSPILIDVRMASYFNTRYGHIKGAYSYPILKMMKKIEELHTNYHDKEVITMCYGGGLSLVAADILQEAGFDNVKSLHDGTDMWAKKQFPTIITDKK